jgi:hypothetical protein
MRSLVAGARRRLLVIPRRHVAPVNVRLRAKDGVCAAEPNRQATAACSHLPDDARVLENEHCAREANTGQQGDERRDRPRTCTAEQEGQGGKVEAFVDNCARVRCLAAIKRTPRGVPGIRSRIDSE